MVFWVNSPGLGPIRTLNTIGDEMLGLLANPAYLGEPIRSGRGGKFNVQSSLYNVDFNFQPIKLHASQDARGPAALSNPGNVNQPIRSRACQDDMAQHALYNPRDLAQPINSSGATCNSMNMASSEFSNLNKPITPNDAMEVDSANILINDCNLAGPITPDNAMEVDSPNVLINKCNLYEPIKPLDAMETDTPDMGQSDLAQSLIALTKLVVLPMASQSNPAYKRDPHWLDQFSSDSSEPMDTFHTPPE
ncbi:hypothetical protein DSO57_1002167 [Entomophthora muscae]|uniref:Uncharacterized protein n=1 Tax=Entomophthora muscae TaxID=34485 RepID=A0ACC2T8K2_9FUNG|nr:hypothetical protein DSO57_1002167 [Entomophthora muscae]